ncbi:MAG: amino acid/amide ABC transporter ATP-binding protein 1, HAAT family [Parcubacteria group bacterium Gr01-1014_24]|nr:MAG: amino acid/amide ABC transporter ATP-binding protein 1, HAAT family [Parcubacteria group bacterium Gr01-1014_24]
MQNIIETKQLVKSFGGVQAVDHLSIPIQQGEITGLVGPNGSGKTTLINLLSGFFSHDSGEVFFLNTARKKILPWENQIYDVTRTFQQIRLFDQISVLDNILVMLTERNPFLALFERHSRYHINQAEDILKRIDLYEKRFHNALDLSYGQRKLLEIGRVLAMNTNIILLDEPFAGLFPEMVKKVEKIIRELKQAGKTIVLVEHNMAIIRSLCDYLIVMDAGKLLAAGHPEKVLSEKIVLEAYLGE